MASNKPQKPGLVTLASDDYVATIDGQDFKVHQGETVTFLPSSISVKDLRLAQRLAKMWDDIGAVDEDDEKLTAAVLMDEGYSEMIAYVKERVISWTWTDDASRPLPQPADEPAIYERIRLDELMYLFNKAQSAGHEASARKNGSAPSATSSSDTPRRRSRG